MNIRDKILEIFGEVAIFATYLNITSEEVIFLVEHGKIICNPYREDTRPSLGLFIKHGKIYVNDFGDRSYYGDVFDFVGRILNKPRPSGSDFITVCEHIATHTNKNIKQDYKIKQIKQFSYFDVIPRAYNKWDTHYWEGFGLTVDDLLKGMVFAIDTLWINGECRYTYDYQDPAYAYILDTIGDKVFYQIYFPYRRSKPHKPRFLTNFSKILHCPNELDVAQILLITKSRKDTLVLRKHLTLIRPDLDIMITNVSTEGYFPFKPHHVFKLKQTYDFIFTLVDNDNTGLTFSREARNNGFQPILFRSHYTKDFSDYRRKYGILATTDLIHKYCDTLEEFINKRNEINYYHAQ